MKTKKESLGFVTLVDSMGDSVSIVNAARVSFGKRREGQLTEDDRRLIRYLWNHQHTSPFRHVTFTFHIKAPIFVLRQWQKHQVGSTFNEISGRYVKFDYEIYEPDEWRASIKNVKQGSGGPLKDQKDPMDLYRWSIQHQYSVYNQLIDMGVCREQARFVLPLSTFSECYWTCSLQALIHFLKLRLAKNAQAEITFYAEAIKAILERDEDMKFILDVCIKS
tara:strand:+ start:983 stop:1645 length:663 start_codon:yes stop_codon:yes gene_type:complete